jgi:hypothetical protein
MTEPPDVVENHYPPAPWHSRGELWMGLFATRRTLDVPVDLRLASPRHHIVLILVRYLEGTLHYDEFIIGSLVRRGYRCGVWVHSIWVDDLASMWGGQRIWQVPKKLASFTWDASSVQIADDHNTVATLSTHPRSIRLPTVPFILPGFSGFAEKRLFTVIRIRGRLRREEIRVVDWSDSLPALAAKTSRFAVAVQPFQLIVPSPTSL